MMDQLTAQLHDKVYPVIGTGNPEGDSVVFFAILIIGLTLIVGFFKRR